MFNKTSVSVAVPESTSDSDPTSGVSVLVANLTAEGRLEISFPKNLAADDAIILIEISKDLSDWVAADAVLDLESEVHNGDGTATFTFETVDPVGADERVFVRLKVASR